MLNSTRPVDTVDNGRRSAVLLEDIFNVPSTASFVGEGCIRNERHRITLFNSTHGVCATRVATLLQSRRSKPSSRTTATSQGGTPPGYSCGQQILPPTTTLYFVPNVAVLATIATIHAGKGLGYCTLLVMEQVVRNHVGVLSQVLGRWQVPCINNATSHQSRCCTNLELYREAKVILPPLPLPLPRSSPSRVPVFPPPHPYR